MKTPAATQNETVPVATPTHRVLTLFDCICIIVGTIIGAGIFEMPAIVAAKVVNIYWLAAVWISGGVVALIGALCFAELTTTYPDRGGDYGYLKRAYHRRVGFAFSWAAFWIIRPGNIGAMAMIFGEFALQAFPNSFLTSIQFAVLSIVVMSATNLLGVTFGKTTQNVLTVAKVIGILVIVVAAFAFELKSSETTGGRATTAAAIASGDSVPSESVTAEETSREQALSLWSSFWLAMVFVMFAFGGWSDIAFVASEVKFPKRNLLRSLALGITSVLVIYLLVNFALIDGLGFEKLVQLGSQGQNPTSSLVTASMGRYGLVFFALLVCVSCLGAINAMIFTSPRIYWATAIDYPALSWLAGARTSRHGWWRAMLLQAAVTIIFVLTFGRKAGGIENIVAATAPYFWLFLGLTIVSLIVCRIRYRGQFSGYRVPLSPMLPLTFAAACIFMTFQAWQYILHQEGMPGAAVLIGVWVLAGVGLSFVFKSNEQNGQ